MHASDQGYGDLEEEVYTNRSEGMVDIEEDEALLLLSTIYGLVQSTMQHCKNKKASKIFDSQEVQ